MSTDRTPIEAHLADDTLLLLGDVTDQAALTELIDALNADHAFADLPGSESASELVASWHHLTACANCMTRQEALMGSVVRSLDAAPAPSEPVWASTATDARISAALDALAPSAAAVSDNLTRQEAPRGRRSWFAFGPGRGRADGISVGSGGTGALTGRRLLVVAAVAAVAVGTLVALRPKTSQVGALKVTADTTVPADGFATERAQSPAKKASGRSDAAADDSAAAFEEPVAGAGRTDGGLDAPTTLPVDIAGTVAAPTPAVDSADEAAAMAPSATVDALNETPANSAAAAPAPIDAPIVGAAPPPSPAPPQAAVPAPAKKVANPAAAAPPLAAGSAADPAPISNPPEAAVPSNSSVSSIPSIGAFADASALLDRFATLHAPVLGLATTTAAPAPAAAAGTASATPVVPSTGGCPGRAGDFRSTATVDGRPVTVLRVREGSTDVDVVLDSASCVELVRRPVAP